MAWSQPLVTTELGSYDVGDGAGSVVSDSSVEGSVALARDEDVRRKWTDLLRRELDSGEFNSWTTHLQTRGNESDPNVPTPVRSIYNWLIEAIAGSVPTSTLDAPVWEVVDRFLSEDVYPERQRTDNFENLFDYVSHDLEDALTDLHASMDEASEEQFPIPSQIARSNAESLLKKMYEISARRFEVYPTPDGEIAIDAPGGHGRSVIVLCSSDGGALCLVNLSGHHRRARYSTADTLPDGFLRDALADLDNP